MAHTNHDLTVIQNNLLFAGVRDNVGPEGVRDVIDVLLFCNTLNAEKVARIAKHFPAATEIFNSGVTDPVELTERL